jgi:hypothetical protein
VKKYVSILFLSVYLLSITQLGELLKLPVMVEHYMEHKELDTTITVWEFLCIHYQDHDVFDADYEKDMKLPFKSHTSSYCSSVVFFPLVPEFKFLPAVIYSYKKQNLFSYSFSYSLGFHTLIWQPPKNC